MPPGFIINFSPTGMIPTKAMTPEVPVQPAEIVAQICEAAALGANMVHIHARDPETGQPSHRKEIYAEIIRAVRKQCPGLVISVSTSGRQVAEFEKRSEVLDLQGDAKPDFASLTLSSLNFNKQASINTPQMIQSLAAKMRERGIRPELEAFDLGMINYAKYLAKKDLLRPPFYFNLILGNIACAQATLLSLGLMINELPPESIWSVGGVGDAQASMNAMAIVAGGGVRVGLEDNIWYDEERTRLATNRELVERVLTIGRAMGRRPCTAQEARALLGLDERMAQ
ncbi:MAG: 3-keto-5-aminohexanoate cleavage protein [Candidatus Eisenbacteria bacterium]|nr:3-keto-5-aminohexanoate cleavage protein [Candidatus Eisenbacteria bacterium]